VPSAPEGQRAAHAQVGWLVEQGLTSQAQGLSLTLTDFSVEFIVKYTVNVQSINHLLQALN